MNSSVKFFDPTRIVAPPPDGIAVLAAAWVAAEVAPVAAPAVVAAVAAIVGAAIVAPVVAPWAAVASVAGDDVAAAEVAADEVPDVPAVPGVPHATRLSSNKSKTAPRPHKVRPCIKTTSLS